MARRCERVVFRAHQRGDVDVGCLGCVDRRRRARTNLPCTGAVAGRRALNVRSKRIAQLDAVRGLAILMVIAHNQGVFADGWMGVDLFFVLSGFLITGILIDTRESAGYFKNFYGKRCLRIWPLYFVVIVFMFVIVPWLRPSEAHTVFDKSSPWWAYPLFLQNVFVASPTSAAGALAVTWSLAIEEQFYFVWPWIVRYASLAAIRRF